LDVTNSGAVAGAEAVQFYVSKTGTKIFRAVSELKGFAKVYLESGETKQVAVTLPTRAFAWYDAQKAAWAVEPGEYEVHAAASSRDIRATVKVEVKNLEKEKPLFDRNSSIGSVIECPEGRAVMHQVLDGVVKTSFIYQEGQDASMLTDRILERFSDMTLKALKLLSAEMPMEIVDQIVELLNKSVS
jgi:beta-glucosidase